MNENVYRWLVVGLLLLVWLSQVWPYPRHESKVEIIDPSVFNETIREQYHRGFRLRTVNVVGGTMVLVFDM